MTDSKHTPKPVLAGFNWAESVKKAEQQGTVAKAEPTPAKPGSQAKTNHQNGPAKANKGGASKSQLRLRVKV